MSLKHCLTALGLLAVMTALASAAPPLRAVVVDGRMNRSHDWRAVSPVLVQLLEETGLFQVERITAPQGEDLSGFRPKFSAYNVVVLNYDAPDWPEAVKQDLVDYMQGGGGLVIYHAADNAFPTWKEFNEMIAVGGWGKRTEKDGPYVRWRNGQIVRDMTPGPGGAHGPQHEYALEVREPQHPIMQGLPPVFMHSKDELYHSLRGPAKNLTVLATSFSPKDKRGSGEHEPMVMTIAYGKGRVFHTTLGHAVEQLKSVAFIVTYQRGAEWAATGKVTQKVPADFPGPDKPRVRP
jgi:type 1 glutamine amidotransferase